MYLPMLISTDPRFVKSETVFLYCLMELCENHFTTIEEDFF
jgi:hypothetical protein